MNTPVESASGGAEPPRGDIFVTTRWTAVLHAGRKSSPQSERALNELCQAYWYPLYAYVRHQGKTKEDAEDLVQAFFEKFLAKNYLEGLAAERGKFRAFLLASLKHFLANEWDKAQRQKRGGGATHLPLDWLGAAERYRLGAPERSSPDQAFDREWALALLERVITRLREENVRAGKADLFEQTKSCLMAGVTAVPHAQAAAALKMEPGAVRVAVHRLRQRYREILREEIAETLSDPARVEDELRALQAALAG